MSEARSNVSISMLFIAALLAGDKFQLTPE
jgi:hypothetical protein